MVPHMLGRHTALNNPNLRTEDLRIMVKTLATYSPRQIANMADTMTINPHGGSNTNMPADKHMENLNAPVTALFKQLVHNQNPFVYLPCIFGSCHR